MKKNAPVYNSECGLLLRDMMFNAISPKKDKNIAKRQSLLEKSSGFIIHNISEKRSSAELISILVRLLIRGILFISRDNIITIPFLKLFSIKVL